MLKGDSISTIRSSRGDQRHVRFAARPISVHFLGLLHPWGHPPALTCGHPYALGRGQRPSPRWCDPGSAAAETAPGVSLLHRRKGGPGSLSQRSLFRVDRCRARTGRRCLPRSFLRPPLVRRQAKAGCAGNQGLRCKYWRAQAVSWLPVFRELPAKQQRHQPPPRFCA